MEFKDKLELVEASVKLADFWGVEPAELLALMVFKSKEKVKEWNKITQEVIEFEKMPIKKRVEKLGLKIKTN